MIYVGSAVWEGFMTAASQPVRTWSLRPEHAPDRWVLGWLHEDGADPIACLRITAESAADARQKAEDWLTAGGDTCRRWIPARDGWIAVTEPPR